jgi:NADH-quinone oxidoreductase subunit L
MFATLRDRFYVDKFYETYVIQAVRWLTAAADWMDRKVWGGLTMVVSQVAVMFAWMVRLFDDYVINLGFDFSCRRVNDGGRLTAKTQSGQIQSYLRVIGIALAVGILLLTWGCGEP